MIKNKLVILSFITIIVIVAASIFANLRAPQSQKEKIPFFPELANQIESISAISIKGNSESINLTRENNVWGFDEFSFIIRILLSVLEHSRKTSKIVKILENTKKIPKCSKVTKCFAKFRKMSTF